MTPAELAADWACIEAATPGEWVALMERDAGCPMVLRGKAGAINVQRDEDATFIAAARTRWPAALTALDVATERIDELCYTHNQLLESHVASQSKVFALTDENTTLRAALAAMTAARDKACDIAKHWMDDDEHDGALMLDHACLDALRAVGGGA